RRRNGPRAGGPGDARTTGVVEDVGCERPLENDATAPRRADTDTCGGDDYRGDAWCRDDDSSRGDLRVVGDGRGGDGLGHRGRDGGRGSVGAAGRNGAAGGAGAAAATHRP